MTESKEHIRKEILSRLKNQSKEERERKSRLIKDKIFSSKVFKEANMAMFYASRDEEVDTRRMIKDALRIGKRAAVPYSDSETNEIIASELVNPEKDLELGPFGIYQPKKDSSLREIPLRDIDVVIVPGVAFDRENRRLGRGKGCYDRFLRKLPPATSTIGVCFDFQLIDRLPYDSHDFPVSKVITN